MVKSKDKKKPGRGLGKHRMPNGEMMTAAEMERMRLRHKRGGKKKRVKPQPTAY